MLYRIQRSFSLAALTLLLTTIPAIAATVPVEGQGDPALYLVKVHADWCGSCQALVPVLQEVRKAVVDQPVLFLELDVTDAARTAQSRLMAAALGVEEHLKANNKTGLVLLIDSAEKALLETLTKKNSSEEMVGKIRAHMAAIGETAG